MGERDAQPGYLRFILGSNFQLPPRNNQPINIEIYGAPQLAVEIASTTLGDDLGRKRLLYERLGVQEYWVVNVALSTVIAFAVTNGGSGEIRESQVLPGLALATVEEAMERSNTEDDGAIRTLAHADISNSVSNPRCIATPAPESILGLITEVL